MELISKEDAIKQIQKVEQEPNYQHDYEDWRDGLIIAENIVDELPTIEERKEGHWIKHFDEAFPGDSTIECSVCHEEQYTTIDDYFCPNCGSRMKGE